MTHFFSVITLKMKTHAVNARWKRVLQLSFIGYWGEQTWIHRLLWQCIVLFLLKDIVYGRKLPCLTPFVWRFTLGIILFEKKIHLKHKSSFSFTPIPSAQKILLILKMSKKKLCFYVRIYGMSQNVTKA